MIKNGTRYIIILSSFVCLLWIIGLGWVFVETSQTSTDTISKPNTIEQAASKNGIQLLALGDSLTRGTGDSTGKGYIGYIKEQLTEKTDKEIQLRNLGIKGLTSTQLKEQVQEAEIQRQAKGADIIFITIGGNDLFQGGESLFDYKEEAILKVSKEYISNLKTILTTLRSVNDTAPIYLMGLYNPFSDLEDGTLTSKIVRDWNYESAEISATFEQTIFVPTYDIFQQNVQSFLYTDHFHPNTQGYQLMADRVTSLLAWEVEENE